MVQRGGISALKLNRIVWILLHSVTAESEEPLSAGQIKRIETLMRNLMPWRKGPFSLYGVNIDTEWRSDWKWDRVLPHLSDLTGRTILDVGCGSGYHMWRMIGAGAHLAVGDRPYATVSVPV